MHFGVMKEEKVQPGAAATTAAATASTFKLSHEEWEKAAEVLGRVRKGAAYHRFVEGKSDVEVKACPALSCHKMTWTPHLQTMLEGTRDDASPWSMLRGKEETLIRNIYSIVFQTWWHSIRHTPPAKSVGRMELPSRGRQAEEFSPQQDWAVNDLRAGGTQNSYYATPRPCESVLYPRDIHEGDYLPEDFYFERIVLGPETTDRPLISSAVCGRVNFPPPRDHNVNMLPFIMGKAESLPEFLQDYYPLIAACPVQELELGKVCYLTVTERYGRASKTQRRGGLHIEAPNPASFRSDPRFVAALEHNWGGGEAFTPDELHGGIFMASNMDHTCAVWNVLVDKHVAGSHGQVDHLRFLMRPSAQYLLGAGNLVWITDQTPHEAVPQREDGYRQFFRLVTSDISLWYADHSTPNPLVPLPEHVTVIHGSKFHAS